MWACVSSAEVLIVERNKNYTYVFWKIYIHVCQVGSFVYYDDKWEL